VYVTSSDTCRLISFSVVLFAVKFTTHGACVPAHVVGRGTNPSIAEGFVLCQTAIVADYAVSCTMPLMTVRAIGAVGGMQVLTVLPSRNGNRRLSTVLTITDVDIV